MSTIFVTGANRGLGRAFVEKYLLRPGTVVVATVRNLGAADAKSLTELRAAAGSRLIIVKIDAKSETDAADAVASLVAGGIDKLDVVIANSGIYSLAAFTPLRLTRTADLAEHFDVNTTGVLRLFQAVLPLLEKSARPVFMTLSSIVGTIGGMEQVAAFPLTAYGTSKAALNFLTRRIHFEHENIIAFASHPGASKTDGGNASARELGLSSNVVEVEDSVNGLIARIDNATRDDTSGKFLSWTDEEQLLW